MEEESQINVPPGIQNVRLREFSDAPSRYGRVDCRTFAANFAQGPGGIRCVAPSAALKSRRKHFGINGEWFSSIIVFKSSGVFVRQFYPLASVF